ncbi:MAG: transposase [Bacteroidales bacterium]|nr:transposase [Bacteroidales bacterium]
MQTKYTEALQTEKYYHIYNRGNNGDNLFYKKSNYEYFFKKFDEYLSDFLIVHAFCLLPNHFHLLVEIKSDKEIIKTIFKKEKYKKLLKNLPDLQNLADLEYTNLTQTYKSGRFNIETDENLSKILSKQFSYFFISYSKSINKQENRRGSLFEKPFKRKSINSEEYYRYLIYYIHYNPVHHGLRDDYSNYQWSSYERILNTKTSKLPKQRIISEFDNKENYIYYHSQEHDAEKYKDIIID